MSAYFHLKLTVKKSKSEKKNSGFFGYLLKINFTTLNVYKTFLSIFYLLNVLVYK